MNRSETMKPWDNIISEEEQRAYRAAGFGRPGGVGAHERARIRRALENYAGRYGRCAASWREVAGQLQTLQLRLDPVTAAPLDPSGTPYVLTKKGCDVDLDLNSRVPYR